VRLGGETNRLQYPGWPGVCVPPHSPLTQWFLVTWELWQNPNTLAIPQTDKISGAGT
jgi:hypothetical protein